MIDRSSGDGIGRAFRTLQLDPGASHELIAAAYWTLFDRIRGQTGLSIAERAVRLEGLSAAFRQATEARRTASAPTAGNDRGRGATRGAAGDPSATPDYYRLLGVDPAADPEIIDTANRLAMAQSGGAVPPTLLTEARAILMEPARRAIYDASRGAAVREDDDGRRPVAAAAGDPTEQEFFQRFGKRAGVASPESGEPDTPPTAELAPALSARTVLSRPQALGLLLLLCALAVGLVVQPTATAISLVAVCSLFYVLAIGFKCVLATRSLSGPREICISDDTLRRMSGADLPTYTVLLPLYRESHMLPQLVDAIHALDYHKHLLDVKLLLEDDDAQTIAAALSASLPDYIDVLVVPSEGPKGKPRACNYGLRRAKGEYLALYDAEDRPEPDQLKKALAAFASGDARLACVQAKLDYYNPDQNLLTHWFTAEYATWFDLYLPGLNSFGAPIPLGGTSNHFRIAALRAVGAWDSFNVTEDADLGIRLARNGFRTAVVNSTTYEEANSHLGNWLRQRSRWIKGYIQTWLVHTRNPLRSVRELGLGGFFAFQMMIFGTFFAYIINPVFWTLVAVWYATRFEGIQAVYAPPLLYVGVASLFFGNFAFVYLGLLGSLRCRHYRSVPYALLMPAYWVLMSVATGRALVQLVVRPHYWEKTRHGLTPVRSPVAGLAD